MLEIDSVKTLSFWISSARTTPFSSEKQMMIQDTPHIWTYDSSWYEFAFPIAGSGGTTRSSWI